MAADTTKLKVSAREESGSRAARRLRRQGIVPGVLYGQGIDSTPIKASAHDLRQALTATGAVIELTVGSASDSRSVVVKDAQHDPVRGELTHVDFLQVRLDEEIVSPVPVELINAEDAPGVKEGGVLEQVTRELNVQALPTAIPDKITIDVSSMEVADTMTLQDVAVPVGVTLLDDLEETVIATITAATELEEPEEVEEETVLIGEDGEPIEGEAAEGEAAEGGEEAGGEAAGGDEKSAGEQGQ